MVVDAACTAECTAKRALWSQPQRRSGMNHGSAADLLVFGRHKKMDEVSAPEEAAFFCFFFFFYYSFLFSHLEVII